MVMFEHASNFAHGLSVFTDELLVELIHVNHLAGQSALLLVRGLLRL